MKTSKLFTKSMVVLMLSTTAASIAPITASANAHHKTSTHKVKKHHSKITKNKDVYHLRNGKTVKFGTKKFGNSEMPYVRTLKKGHKKQVTHVVKKHVTKKHTKKSKSFLTSLEKASKRIAEKRAKNQKIRKAKAEKFKANVKHSLKKHWYTRWLA